eukprot:1159127-Pyramimonas_sp.AAC.2
MMFTPARTELRADPVLLGFQRAVEILNYDLTAYRNPATFKCYTHHQRAGRRGRPETGHNNKQLWKNSYLPAIRRDSAVMLFNAMSDSTGIPYRRAIACARQPTI